jgi:hypothetical protein
MRRRVLNSAKAETQTEQHKVAGLIESVWGYMALRNSPCRVLACLINRRLLNESARPRTAVKPYFQTRIKMKTLVESQEKAYFRDVAAFGCEMSHSHRIELVQPIAQRELHADHVEMLPFTVSLVQSEDDLRDAVAIRHAAYGHHLPELAHKFEHAESADHSDIVLLARAKADGRAIGTMRVRVSDQAPLQAAQVLPLPTDLHGKRLAEATRLAVRGAGNGRMVRDALFKAFWMICEARHVDYMVIASRAAMARTYEWLGFTDLVPGAGLIPLPYAANLPHRVLSFDLRSARRNWRASKHPMYDFVVATTHPDLQLCDSGSDQPVRSPNSYDASVLHGRLN